MTLRTQIAWMPGRPATGPSITGAGSVAQRDRHGLQQVPADEARSPRAGAAWPPRMAPVEPQWLCMRARVPLAATNCDSLAMVRSGSDGTEVGYGSAKRKYGVGGMDEVWNRKYEPGPIRDGDRFDRIDLCAYSAPGAHGITELVSDLNFSSRGRQFQSGRSGPLEAPRQKLSSA